MKKKERPSETIMRLARKKLDKEKANGMFLFPEGIHEEKLIDAICEFLDNTIPEKDWYSTPTT